MGLSVSSSGGGDFEMTPAGVYVARCYRIIDMGTQTSTGQFGTKSQKKVMISWELLDDEAKMSDGRPFAVHQFYTASLSEKAKLRADLEAWRNKKFTSEELESFDLMTVLGAYCQIQVVHSEDGKYANVQTIMAYKGDKPEPVNEDTSFDIDNPDMKVFESLSDGMKTKITSSPEWQERQDKVAKPAPKQVDDVVIEDTDQPINLADIPF